MTSRRPVALVILDGWGLREEVTANAVALAATPVFDRLTQRYGYARLRTSGGDVGLPEGQMGNSEVGHLTLGAGAISDQDLLRINQAIEAGELDRRPVLESAFAHVHAHDGALHLLGLLGEGGVHAHSDHLKALLAAASRSGIDRVFIHAFTDGRDTAPGSGRGYMTDLVHYMQQEGVGQIASVSGRYHAMDRDRRWERTERAWRAMRHADAIRRFASAGEAIEAAYAAGETDEFVSPSVILGLDRRPLARIEEGDAVLMFNFRADRMRQLLAVLTEPDFDAFAPNRPGRLFVASMTEYVKHQAAPAIFPPRDVEWPLARLISEAGLRQYHTAETEKYAHVTYFFNGGRELPFEGETHRVIASPKVATYDLQPSMSAVEVTDRLVERLAEGGDDFLLVNYANPDMVGHTGDLEAAIEAVETVDVCLGRVLAAIADRRGCAIVTADHGNCEMMIDPETGGPHTAHTLNPVPCIIVHPDFERSGPIAPIPLVDGGLRDVAPTILRLIDLPVPDTMTGRPLFDTDAE